MLMFCLDFFYYVICERILVLVENMIIRESSIKFIDFLIMFLGGFILWGFLCYWEMVLRRMVVEVWSLIGNEKDNVVL